MNEHKCQFHQPCHLYGMDLLAGHSNTIAWRHQWWHGIDSMHEILYFCWHNKNISNFIQSSQHPDMYLTFATQAHETNMDSRGSGTAGRSTIRPSSHAGVELEPPVCGWPLAGRNVLPVRCLCLAFPMAPHVQRHHTVPPARPKRPARPEKPKKIASAFQTQTNESLSTDQIESNAA